VAPDIGGDDVGRNALLVELAIVLHAGADDAELDRVEHAPAIGQAVEAMPFLAGMQDPAIRIRGKLFGRCLVEWHLLAGLRIGDLIGIPRREEPFLLGQEFLPRIRHGEAASHGFVDALLRERVATGPIHDRGGHVVRGDQRIQRRGAGLGAVRLVEASVIDGALAVPDVDPRGLRQRRQ
jgi:hypothetical protein